MARRIVLALAFAGLVVTAIATVRLGAVVAATPARLWLIEYPRLVDLAEPADESTRSLAEWLVRFLDDPDLLRARIGVCAEIAGARGPNTGLESCLAVLDDALRANPSSGELWLFRASLLFYANELGPPIATALRYSYRTSPREGWLAAERILLGLRLYPLLPTDLQADVRSDLEMVMSNATFALPLLETYPRDPALRRAAAEALRDLRPDLLNKFVDMVRSYVVP